MKKYCVVSEIKPECMKSYINHHKEIHKSPYKELLQIIKKSGVKEEAIFIYKNLAIIYFEADDIDRCYEFQKGFEVVKRWNKLMAPLFESVYKFDSSKKLKTLEKIFDLNEQLKGKLDITYI
jgi:L-rhamnose mutarotase